MNLGVLSSGTTVQFAPDAAGSTTPNVGTLMLNEIIGSNLINGLGYGDVISLSGLTPILTGNVIVTPTGTATLAPPPTGSGYTLVQGSAEGTSAVVLTPNTIDVYRFFDSINGTQFYTASQSERNTLLATRPDLVPEGPGGVGLQAVDPAANDPNAAQVFRFFDTRLGTHFFTTSTSERDTIVATRNDLKLEANSSFLEHATQQVGDVPVYRFFDSVHGTHFYTDSSTERASILSSRPDLINEGIGFYEPPKHTS